MPKLTDAQLRALRFYAAPFGEERRKIGNPRWDVTERLSALGLVEKMPDSFVMRLTNSGRAALDAVEGGALRDRPHPFEPSTETTARRSTEPGCAECGNRESYPAHT